MHKRIDARLGARELGSQVSSGDDSWSNNSSPRSESDWANVEASADSRTGKLSDASLARLRSWEQNMKRSPRHGRIGTTVDSAHHGGWLLSATVQHFQFADQPSSELLVRKEECHRKTEPTRGEEYSRRVELQVPDVMTATMVKSEQSNGVVREHFAVSRQLDGERPEIVLRHVSTAFGDDALGQYGHASSFGDRSAVVALVRKAAERAGVSAATFVTSLHAVQGEDNLVAKAVCNLADVTA